MKQIEVRILPLTENQFLTTFEHPLTKKKVRQKFLTRKEAQEYKVEIEHQFRRGKVKNYRELTIEELLCLFMEDCLFMKDYQNRRESVQSFASFGSTSGVNFIAFAMLPLIFILPVMKAS